MRADPPELTSRFWDEVLPQLAFVPQSVPVGDLLYGLANAPALRRAHPELLAEPTYPDLRAWTETLAAIDLWSVEGADARCRELVATLLAEPSPYARLRLFHLLELWARAHAPELATQIEDSLRPHLDLERGVEHDPLDALRTLAAVCTLLGSERMEYSGLAVLVDERSASASAQQILDRFVAHARVYETDSLQIHGHCENDGRLIDPPKLTVVRQSQTSAAAAKLGEGIIQFFALYAAHEPPYLSEHQRRFVAEDLRPHVNRLLAGAEIHEVLGERSLTCCGGALYLVEAPTRWLAIQLYMYC
jgi:hypothetical protein